MVSPSGQVLTGTEELDSYMYQTVGQDAIQLVADALDVPLYRGIISGQAIEQGSEYGDRTSSTRGVVGDETEDLFKLLSNVKVLFVYSSPLYFFLTVCGRKIIQIYKGYQWGRFSLTTNASGWSMCELDTALL